MSFAIGDRVVVSVTSDSPDAHTNGQIGIVTAIDVPTRANGDSSFDPPRGAPGVRIKPLGCPFEMTFLPEDLRPYEDRHVPGKASLEDMLRAMRGAHWSVAVHNDYRLNGHSYTFWLFTHPSGSYLKGEGPTDVDALRVILRQTGIVCYDESGKEARLL